MVTAYKHRLSTGHTVYLANHRDHVTLILSSNDKSQWSTQQFSVGSGLSEPRLYPTAQGAVITLADETRTYCIHCQHGQMQITAQASDQAMTDLRGLSAQAMEQTEPIAETFSSATNMPPMEASPMEMSPIMSPMSMSPMDTASSFTSGSASSSASSSTSGFTSDSTTDSMSMHMGNMSMSMRPLESSFSSHVDANSASSKSKRRFCTQCGSSVAPEDKFCGQCGAALS